MGGSVMAVVINGTTGIDKVQDGSIGTADIAADAITTPKIADTVNLGRRNLVINGAMQVAQRGTSHTYSNNQSGYHSLDRIYSACFSSGGTLALSQQHAGHDGVDAPKFLRATTAGTEGAGATVYSQHSIEGIEQFSNKQVTISFMVKANASTTFQLRREYYYGSGGTSTEYSGFVDVPVTTSWTKFTHTFSAVDFSSKTIGSSNYYSLMFYWSTNQGSNKVRDGNIDITNIQLEFGDTATPFEHRSYGEELSACQRYCQLLTAAAGFASSTSAVEFGIGFYPEMRGAPSAAATAALIVERHNITAYTQSSAAVTIVHSTSRGAKFTISNFSGLTAGNGYTYSGYQSGSGHIILSAEI
jgi:hypothetical protein